MSAVFVQVQWEASEGLYVGEQLFKSSPWMFCEERNVSARVGADLESSWLETNPSGCREMSCWRGSLEGR